jgi:hypothetical protein
MHVEAEFDLPPNTLDPHDVEAFEIPPPTKE